jgi:ADP-ribose pyrophosphatase
VSQSPRPWQRLRRGLEHDYLILKVRRDVFADPRTDSEHPRVFIDTPDWVNVVAVTPEDQLILVRQYRFGIEAPTLEIPGGLVEPGEEPAAAAARELEEETGYAPGRLVALGAGPAYGAAPASQPQPQSSKNADSPSSQKNRSTAHCSGSWET